MTLAMYPLWLLYFRIPIRVRKRSTDDTACLADFSSMLAEIFMLDKPVIYMDNDSGLYQIAKQICCSFYKETDWEHIETRIEKIMNGIDEKKEERWEIANQLNISPASVRAYISRARKKAYKIMEGGADSD